MIIISVFLLLLGGWWVNSALKERASDASSASKTIATKNEATEIVTVPVGAKVRQGPGESFQIIVTIESPTTGNIIDKTVPGWVKVNTALGIQGWIESEKH